MKKFTKLFLSCALVSAMAVTAASSAFAAMDAEYPITGDLTGTYTVASEQITALEGVTPDSGTQVTFLVYEQGDDTTSVSAASVIGIDQGTTVKPVNNGLKAGSVKETEGKQTTYVVKVGYTEGGTFKVATGTFSVGDEPTPAYLVGDANMSEDISAADCTTIAKHCARISILTDVAALAADANLDEDISAADATAVAKYLARLVDQATSPIGKAPAKN